MDVVAGQCRNGQAAHQDPGVGLERRPRSCRSATRATGSARSSGRRCRAPPPRRARPPPATSDGRCDGPPRRSRSPTRRCPRWPVPTRRGRGRAAPPTQCANIFRALSTISTSQDDSATAPSARSTHTLDDNRVSITAQAATKVNSRRVTSGSVRSQRDETAPRGRPSGPPGPPEHQTEWRGRPACH